MVALAERAKLWYQLKLLSESVDFIIWRWFSSFSLQKCFCRDQVFDQSVLTFYIIMHTYALAIRFVLGKLFTYTNRNPSQINEFGKSVVLSGSYLYGKCQWFVCGTMFFGFNHFLHPKKWIRSKAAMGMHSDYFCCCLYCLRFLCIHLNHQTGKKKVMKRSWCNFLLKKREVCI